MCGVHARLAGGEPMSNIIKPGPKSPSPRPTVTINSKALAAVVNVKCHGFINIGGDKVTLRSDDGRFMFEVPKDFAKIIEPGEMGIVSITLIKNELLAIPEGDVNADPA